MFANLQLGENAPLIIFCAVLAGLALAFFVTVYIVSFKDDRKKAKRKRGFERSMQHAQRRRQKSQ